MLESMSSSTMPEDNSDLGNRDRRGSPRLHCMKYELSGGGQFFGLKFRKTAVRYVGDGSSLFCDAVMTSG